ncbi:ATP-binding cassette sub-family A member 12, partial [Clarias magur]
VWSLVLLLWPLVIFIILAVTRIQFPPLLTGTCYVAPRNLPSAGFFPFLQTLMCNSDSSCSSTSYLPDSSTKGLRHRRDVDAHGFPLLPHGFLPSLSDLEKFHLVHKIMKRDTTNSTQMLQQWDSWLNSSMQASSNLSMSIMNAINNTLTDNQDILDPFLETSDILKTAFCNISMSVLSTYDHDHSALEDFCTSNDTALEFSLSTLKQLITQLVLQDPLKVIMAVEMSVETIDKLQTQLPLWDFLLGLPESFLKTADQETIAENLMGMKKAWNSIQSSFQAANTSMDMLNPIIDESIELLNYLQTWEGRNVNISLGDILTPSNMSLITSENASWIHDLQIPLNKVLVLFDRDAFLEFMCTNKSFCDSQQVDMIYEWIDQEKVALQMLLVWSQSTNSPEDLAFAKNFLGKLFGDFSWPGSNAGFNRSDEQPETIQEQLFLFVGNTVMGMLSGTPGWDYVQTLFMGAHSAMQFATAVMETELAHIKPLLTSQENLQVTITSFIQNQTTVDEAPWLNVGEKLNQLSSVFNGTLVYNVTPSVILTEWHRLYRTSIKFSDVLEDIVGLIQGKLFSQMPQNSTVDWSEILLNSGLEEFAMMGSVVQNSSHWSTMEPYFQLAYWVMAYQPNVTVPPNCTFTPNATICDTGFTWDEFIPLVWSLHQEIRENPAALLRPIQGAVSLFKGIIMDTYMNHLQEYLNTTEPDLARAVPQNLSLHLTDLVNHHLPLLSNITVMEELGEDILLAILNDTLEAFGLGRLEVLWSGDLKYSEPNSVVMNILQLLSPESIQTFNNEGQFAVLFAILHELGERLAPEQQIQLEGVLNNTNVLFEDLALCTAKGQDCLSDASQLFQILSLLDEMVPAEEYGNFSIKPIESNVTWSVASRILSLILPWNVSKSSPWTMDNISKIINLLEQLSASSNLSINTIQEELQALNITNLGQFVNLSEAYSLSLLFSKLMDHGNMSQCLNPLLNDSASPIDSTAPKCTVQIIEGLIDFLQSIPMLEGLHANLTSILNMVLDEAIELRNISSLESDLPELAEELLLAFSTNPKLNTVIINIIQLLSPKSIQMLYNERKYAVLGAILSELGQLFADEKQINLEGILNQTHALFEQLALCAESDQDCLSGVSQIFQTLCLLDEMIPAGDYLSMRPIESNMTLSVAVHFLSLFLSSNMSESSNYTMNNVSDILHLLEQLSGLPNLNHSTIQEDNQALNCTDLDFEKYSLSLLLLKLMNLVNVSQCLDPLLQDPTSHNDSMLPECNMQIIMGVFDFLQAMPMLQECSINLTSILNMVFDEAMDLQNISSLESELPEVMEELLLAISNNPQLNTVVMNIIQLLSPKSIQMLHSEGKFAVLGAILHELGEHFADEKQINLEEFLSHTHALFEQLALCAESDQDCLTGVSQIFQTLCTLDKMIPLGEGGNFSMTPIESNMTLSVAGHILSIFLSWNMSEHSNYTMNNISDILHLLEQLSGLPNASISTIQEARQALNCTHFDLEQYSLSLLLSKLKALVNISQCLDPLLQDPTLYKGLIQSDCKMQIIEGVLDFLQAIPMLEDCSTNLTSIFNIVFDEALEIHNISSLKSELPGLAEKLLLAVSNNTQVNTVVMNVIQLLSPKSIQMLQTEGNFSVLDTFLRELGELLDGEQKMNLEGFLNQTHALFEELTLCAESGQTCLSEVSEIFQVFSLLDEMIVERELGNFTMLHIQNNMTLSVVAHILSLFLPWNMSESSDYPMTNVSEIIHILEQLFSSPNLSIDSILECLQALNLTSYDFAQFTNLSDTSSLSLPLSKLMDFFNTSQCLNHIPQDPKFNTTSPVPECTMEIIGGLIDLLQAIPMHEGFKTNLTSILNIIHDEAMTLKNISNQQSDPLEVTEDVLEIILESIRMKLENLNVKNVSLIEMDFDTLKGLLKVVFDDEYRYPYYMINTTLMTQQSYAQKMYTDIILWYLQNLENATNDSMFNEILDRFIILTENMATVSAAQLNFTTLVSNQIQDLIGHVQPPLNSEDLSVIHNAIVSIMEGHIQLIKVNLDFQQTLYDSLGLQTNMSFPADVEVEIQNYFNLMETWIMNPQLMLVFSQILQWNKTLTDFRTPVMDLEQILQALAPMLSPEEQVYINKTEQILQPLNYILELGQTDNGLQSENFTEAIMDIIRMMLENVFNYTNTTYADENIAGVFYNLIQLLQNPNTSKPQELMTEIANVIESVISTFDLDLAEALSPNIQNLLTYVNTFSSPGGPPQWHEIIVDIMEEIQNSLPSNSTAKPYISSILNITNYILGNKQDNTSLWASLAELNPDNLDNVTQQLPDLLDFILPLLSDHQEMGLTPEYISALTEYVPILLQIFSGAPDPLMFQRLGNVTTALLSSLMTTPAGDTLHVALDIIRNVTASMVQNVQAQTELYSSLSVLLSDVFAAVNSSDVPLLTDALLQALQSTTDVAFQAPGNGNMLNCTEVSNIWERVTDAGGLNISLFTSWHHNYLLPLLKMNNTYQYQPAVFNKTDVDPQWVDATVAEIVSSLEALYSASFNESLAMQHLAQSLVEYFNQSLSAAGNLSDWSDLLSQLQSLSFGQDALENAMLHLNQLGWSQYVLAAQKAIDYSLGYQNVTASPEMVLHALNVVLTAMNFSSEQIDSFLNNDITPKNFSHEILIKEVIRNIIDMRLFGNWSMIYDVMEQLVYIENTSNILASVSELVSWYNTTEDTGLYFGIEMLTKLFNILRPLMSASNPQPSCSDIFIDLAGNVLYALQHITAPNNPFSPINDYLNPIQMKLAQGDNLRDIVSATQNARRPITNLTREPIDDFLDLLEINYQNLSKILSIPLSSEEMLDTMHVLFAHPDLGIFLKGVSRDITGSSSQDEIIDTILGMLANFTLPSNGHLFKQMITQTMSQGWSPSDVQLVESLGGLVGMVRMFSQQPSLGIAQMVDQMANQLTSAASYTMANKGNRSDVILAINDILSQNLPQVLNTTLMHQSIIQSLIGSVSSMSQSQIDFGSYMMAINQTADAFASLVPPEEIVFFNISAQILEAFALLMSYPTDLEKVVMSSNKIADSLALGFVHADNTTLSNGQSINEIAYPLILHSALATEILFNLSASNNTFSNDLERRMILTRIMSSLPVRDQDDIHTLMSSLLLALSNVSDTAQIRPAFFEIYQNVTLYLLKSQNLTEDPMSMGVYSVLSTVLNEVSTCLSRSLMENSSTSDLPYMLDSLRAIISSLSLELPLGEQQYPDVIFNFMETLAMALNHTITNEDLAGGMDMLFSSVQRLLETIANNNTNTSIGIMSNLENTLLMVLSSRQDPSSQSGNMTQKILTTIQNLLVMANSSSEIDLATAILGAIGMNIESLMTNDSNWTQRLRTVLLSISSILPADLQFGPFNRTIFETLANEPPGNLNVLLQTASIVSELFSTSWMNDSFGALLDEMQTQVCTLENMDSVQMISQALSLSPGLLCHTAVHSIRAVHVITSNLVNETTALYDLLYQNLVGDPSTYNLEMDWSGVLSNLLGIDLKSLPTFNVNQSAPSELKVSDLLKNQTLFATEVIQYTRISPQVLNTLLESSLPQSNLQILSLLKNLQQCANLPSLQLEPSVLQIFSSLCSLSTQEWYSLAVLTAQHANVENIMYKLLLSNEIQGLFDVLMGMVTFFMDLMNKLTPTLRRLEEYFTAFADTQMTSYSELSNLVRGKRSVTSPRTTFVTISRALCKSGMMSLFGISQLPSMGEGNPSLQDPKKVEDLMTKFKIPQDATPFCKNIFLDMVSTTGGAVAWAFLKPMLLGQVLYYPDTPLTQTIVQKSNITLQQFGDMRVHAGEWLQASPYFMQSAQLLNETLPMLKNSLSNPFVQNFIKKQIDIDIAELQDTLNAFSNMTEMLEKNQFILQQITTLSNLMMNLSSCVNFNRYRGFNSTEELNSQAEKLAKNRELYASVIFKLPTGNSSSPLPPKVDYTIRMNIDNSMRTDRSRNPFWVRASYISPVVTQRYNRGFIYLQESIERAIIGMQTGTVVQEPAVQIQAFPYPCFYKDEYLNSIAFALPLVLMCSWVLFVADFVKKLVHERELRLHEYMKMMGVTPISHFLAWFIESATFLIFTVIIMTIILKSSGILPKTDPIILFLYLSDNALSILAISFLVSAFFDKTNVAGLSGSLLYVICFFPFIVVLCLEDNLSIFVKTMLSLFSPTCFSYASQYITSYEKMEQGIQWNNMYLSPVPGDPVSFGMLCWLLFIDSIIYFLLGAYIRMVFPGKYGIPAPWYFPVMPSFWAEVFGCTKRSQKKAGRGLLFSNMVQENQRSGKDKNKGLGDLHPHGDEEFPELPVGVSLRGLTKTYGKRSAIENLNLTFYEGHVTALLGHNGAGKTTTMSLLTGLFAPSSGTIEVYGKDMQASTKAVHKDLGVCMQYDVHFDHLTTKEHLMLYGHIKAPHWSKQELKEQVRKILEETGMYAHRHKRVGTLSGGMKRRLSISIAFIGGSRLVVLDEPTTGVDPCSRRSIWDIVLQHKSDRTIILSTHHLDEAEVLSDRIAFLERGGLKCCGSPFYLKDKLARGYKLTLTKKVLPPDSEDKFDIKKVKTFIQSHLPEAELKEADMGDIVYSLPVYNSQNASVYRSLLNGLDQNLEALQLGCYGISDTTLEEVFLHLTRDTVYHEEVENRPYTVSNPDLDTSKENLSDDLNCSMNFGEKASLTGNSTVSGLALMAQQVMAVLIKRFHHTRRNWKGLISQVLLPVMFVLAAMGLGSIKSDLQHFPEMELTPAMYDSGKQYSFFSNQNSSSSYLVDTMMSYPGIDNYCVNHPDSMTCQNTGASGSDQWTSQGNPVPAFEECKCSGLTQTCPAPGYDPPHKTNPSSKIVYNLTNMNIERYLLATANDFIRDRYGGWSFGSPLPSNLQMDILEVPKNRTLTKVWYNPEGHHTMPAYVNSLNNFILRSKIPASQQPQQYAISVSSHPYPGQVEKEDALLRNMVNILVGLCVLIGYSIMTASFVIYEVQEHHTGSKMLQHISGISEPFYWIINFFYDMVLYMVPVVLTIIVIAIFRLPAFTDRLNLGAVSLLLMLFGFATFPWMYLMSTMFKDTEKAFISYVCINLFLSMNTIISTSVVYFLKETNPNVKMDEAYRIMSNLFLIFPQFSFGNGLMELARVDLQVQILSSYGVDAYKDPFSMDVLGWMFISLFLQGFICFTLRLLMNKRLSRQVRRLWTRLLSVPQTGSWGQDVDEDVLAERQRVDSGAAGSDLLQVSRLTKVYRHLNRRVQAVNKLSFGIPAGECFGLLGVNGAGKTTTFKMLTGDISPTDGSAQVLDWDGRMVDIMDCRTEGINIGYCPQVDALDDLLTGEEHLYFYARVRGICKRELDQVVNYLLKKLQLSYHRQIISERYSCGTRRKLSTALALIGQPQILLLDEPSSGMDPRSKRHLWKIISEEVMGKSAVVLTSHSMEECEALCTRLAIMVQGQFRCLGSLQHIKNRFGSGFTVKMYLTSSSCNVDTITTFMQRQFPSTYLKEHHSSMVEYHVPVAPGGVADIFDQLETNKTALQIKHFSVSQTTLDE